MAGKSKTGMEEMLGKLFGSSGMTETIDRIERVQAPQPATTNPTLSATPPELLTPSPVDTHTGTHTDIHSGIGTGIHTDSNTRRHTSIDTGIHTNTQTGIDTGIDAYTDKNPCQPAGIETDMGANTATGTETGIHAGTLNETPNGTYADTHTGIHNGIQTGMHIGTDIGEYLYINIDPELWYPFTENQGRVLLYLIEAGGKTNRNYIERDTGVPLSSVAKVLSMLEQKGYIKRAEHKHYEHRQRGFYYSVNTQACAEFYERVRGQRIGTDTGIYTGIHPGTHAGPATGTRVGTHVGINTGMNAGIQARTHTSPQNAFSSSRKEEKLTTAENPELETLLKDPELGYWREKGVNGRQVNAWTEEFQMPVDQVLQSLRYCRYDMVILNQEEEKQISNPMNWFYKVMQRSGLYPKPAGYKSLAEIRAEQMEQAARDAAEVRERQANAERELAFQKIMSDPDGHAYQSLLAQVNEFAKEMGGKALEVALREAFDGVIHHTKGESP